MSTATGEFVQILLEEMDWRLEGQDPPEQPIGPEAREWSGPPGGRPQPQVMQEAALHAFREWLTPALHLDPLYERMYERFYRDDERRIRPLQAGQDWDETRETIGRNHLDNVRAWPLDENSSWGLLTARHLLEALEKGETLETMKEVAQLVVTLAVCGIRAEEELGETGLEGPGTLRKACLGLLQALQPGERTGK